VGALLDNEQMEAEGKVAEVKGEARQKANRTTWYAVFFGQERAGDVAERLEPLFSRVVAKAAPLNAVPTAQTPGHENALQA
jgi:hypothetical protein